MHPLGRKALHKLLTKAERHRIRQSGAPSPSLKFSAASFPEYPAFSRKGSRADMEAIHADLNEARRASAIAIDWDPRAGDNGQVARIRLVDGEALALVLGLTPRWHHVAEAERLIAPWREHWRVESIWDAWSTDKKVRGLGPENADKLCDACRVLDALLQAPAADVPVRRLSAQMFHDSKYIETRLVALLDELTRQDVATSDTSLVLTRLGLLKHPQPLLLAGTGMIRLRPDKVAELLPPYVGIAPDYFDGLGCSWVKRVLTIENLTTFNEVARALTPDSEALVLYTGGVPSPSFRDAYSRLVADCTCEVDFWHWGDIDVGGFRIARMLAELLPEYFLLKPWMMNPRQAPETALNTNVPSSTTSEMEALARRLGWHDVAESINQVPGVVEQEVLAPDLPF